MNVRSVLAGLALVCGIAPAAVPARAVAQTNIWVAAGPAVGGLGLDEDLANYRWDTRPSAQWGGRVLAGRGPFAVGLCAWRAGTSQGTGLPGVEAEPQVALSALSAVGMVRVATPLGCEVWFGGQAGRLRASWEPGELVVATGGGAPVTVDFDDVDEWCLGFSAEVQRRLGRGLVVAVQAERSTFALETAHRRGDVIERDRDRFSLWSARVQLAWWWPL